MSVLPAINDININEKYWNKKIDSSKLVELTKSKILKPAPCQHPISEDKVEDLIKTYKSENGHYIHLLRNNITVAVYKGKDNKYEYFNIDGQHRMEMGIKLWEEGYRDISFNVNFIYCNTTDEIINIFEELNLSDDRKKFIITNDYFLFDLRNILTTKYSNCFSKTIRNNSHLLTIEEFIVNLRDINIDKYVEDKKYENAEKFLEEIIKANKIYNTKVNEHGYTELKNNHTSSNKIFYNDEIELLDNKETITIGFKRNNFLFRYNDDNEIKRGWFFRKNSIKPEHEPRNPRTVISQIIKKKVWEKEYEDICDSDDNIFELNPKCPVYKCKTRITFETCEMGHKKSRAKGGRSIVENLRPICRQCNQKMGETNWTDYIRDLKLENAHS